MIDHSRNHRRPWGVISPALLRYAAVGGLNTVFGYAIIFGCMYFLSLGSAQSNGVGYGAGFILSFFLNRRFTFGSNARVASAMPRFLLVTVIAYLGNLVTVLFFERFAGVNAYVAQITGVFPYFLIGYLGSRYFVFSDTAVSGRKNRFW